MKRGGRFDELLTLLFMLLAIATVICFFTVDNRLPFWICGGAAVLLRSVQYILRFFA
jgi:Ca2+/Na+ antiporter